MSPVPSLGVVVWPGVTEGGRSSGSVRGDAPGLIERWWKLPERTQNVQRTIDRFQVNWLRKFWSSFKLVTFYAINKCYRTGTLTSSLRTGIIRLLRKGQKDPTLTGNYRPISLLSIHYKLASCCITQRLRPLVGRVIGTQQKAYVPGNVIGSCIVNLLNLIEHTDRKIVESLIFLDDFRQAFDYLSHRYINECLKLSNVSPPSANGSHSSFLTEKPTSSYLNKESLREM